MIFIPLFESRYSRKLVKG